MESLIEDLYFLDVFKDICEDLNIALKILTADSPAEVKGYSSLPSCSGLSKGNFKQTQHTAYAYYIHCT